MKTSKNIPKFRFDGFTDTWEQRKLEDVCSIQGGNAWKSEIYAKNGSHLVVTIANVTGDYYIDDTKGNRVDLDDENSPYILNENDILVSLTGNVGRVSKMTRANAVLNQRVGRVKINDINKVEHDFLFYILKSAQFEESMKNASQGAAQANISNKDILSFVIKYPNLSEQQSIGSFFSTLDHLITLQQRELDYLKETKKTMLSELFPKKSETIPGVRFDGFTDTWEQRKLGELSEIIGGGTPSTQNPEYWDGEINWYAPAEIGESIYVKSSKRRITKLGLEKSSAKLLPVGTVLFTSRAGIGNTAILKTEGTTNQGFQSIVPIIGKLDSYFIYSRTKELKQYAEKVGAGSTFVEVSRKQMSEAPFLFPQVSEQKSIGSFFSMIDRLITLQQRKLDLLKSQKQTLLKSMFPR